MNRRFQQLPTKCMSLLSLLVLLSFFSACGGKNVQTVAKVQIFSGVAQLAVNNATGGLVLFGKSDNGSAFSRVVDTSTGLVDLTLPNGTWVFSSIAWNGTNAFEGTVRCGATQPTQLTGADLNLNLNLTNTGCDTPGFAGAIGMTPGTPKDFATFQPLSCQDLTFDPSTQSTLASKTSICDDKPTSAPYKALKGHIGSLKVVVDNFDILKGNFVARTGSVLESACLTFDPLNSFFSLMNRRSSNTSNIAYLNLPPGNGTMGLAFKVIGFFDNKTCTASTNGDKVFNFPFGMSSANAGHAKFHGFTATGTTTNYQNIYLRSTDQDVCSGGRLSGTSFPAGTGTADHPYVICTKAQFNSIADVALNLSSSFRLGADLDYQFSTSTNIVPTGGVLTTPTPFSGNFFGNDHRIFNIIYPSGTFSRVGLFRKISSSANVNNLILDNISIKASTSQNYVGILAGEVASGSSINNIFIRNSSVSGGNYVGLAVGSAQSTAFNQVHATGDVRGGNNVGGLIGELNASSNSLSQASFQGKVIGGSTVGGIVGFLNTAAVTLSQLRSAGFVMGNNNVGGLVGATTSTTATKTLSYSYSLASVRGLASTASSTGGLVGEGHSSFSINNSFQTLGAITAGDGNQGGISGLGASNPTCSSVYSSGPSNTICSGMTGLTTGSIKTNSSTFGTGISSTIQIPVTSTYWFKTSTDNTYDFPQLMWEKEFENTKLPYLKRICSGLYTGQSSRAGAGTLSSPKSVCDSAQFANMASDGFSYYILKTDIDLSDQVNSSSSSKIATMNFSLDGDNHIVTNMKTTLSSTSCTGNVGYFGQLNSGKFLKNFSLYGLSLEFVSTNNCTASSYTLMGGLIGLNSGTVQNIFVDGLNFKFVGQISLGSNQQHKIGAIIGSNNSSGIIRSVKAFGNLDFNSNLGTPGDASNLFLGGIAGDNNGVIEKSEEGIFISRTSGSGEFGNSQNIGGVTGKNSGTISEVKSGANINLTPSTASYPASARTGGIAGTNDGTVMNCISRTTFQTNSNSDPISSPYHRKGGLVGFNATGGVLQSSYYQKGINSNLLNYTTYSGALVGGYALYATSSKFENLFSWNTNGTGDFGTTTGVPANTAAGHGTVTNVISSGLTASAPSTAYTSGTYNYVTITAGSGTYTTSSGFSINNNILSAKSNGNSWLHSGTSDDFLMLTALQD